MITSVDSNVLIDVLEADPVHGPSSKEALTRCMREGSVVACEVVWAEVATAYAHDLPGLVSILERIGVAFSPMTREAALEAARRWHAYRRRRPAERRIAADFLIGGHALMQCDRLLTRDAGFYRSRYKGLRLAPVGTQPPTRD